MQLNEAKLGQEVEVLEGKYKGQIGTYLGVISDSLGRISINGIVLPIAVDRKVQSVQANRSGQYVPKDIDEKEKQEQQLKEAKMATKKNTKKSEETTKKATAKQATKTKQPSTQLNERQKTCYNAMKKLLPKPTSDKAPALHKERIAKIDNYYKFAKSINDTALYFTLWSLMSKGYIMPVELTTVSGSWRLLK